MATDYVKKINGKSIAASEVAPSSSLETKLDGIASVATKVKATAKTDNVNYKILATASASPTSGNATEAVYDTDITLNPSTNTIAANVSGTAAKPAVTVLSSQSNDLAAYTGSNKGDVLWYRWEASSVPQGAPLVSTSALMCVQRIATNETRQTVYCGSGQIFTRKSVNGTFDYSWSDLGGVSPENYSTGIIFGTNSGGKYYELANIRSVCSLNITTTSIFLIDRLISNDTKQDLGYLEISSTCTDATTPTFTFSASLVMISNNVTNAQIKVYGNASTGIVYIYAFGKTTLTANDTGHVGARGILVTAGDISVGIGTLVTFSSSGVILENAPTGLTAIPIINSTHTHSADDLTSGVLPVSRGGTGITTTVNKNAVIIGNSSDGTGAMQTIATLSGAFYSKGANSKPVFGTLPVAQGGTGLTTTTNKNAVIIGNASSGTGAMQAVATASGAFYSTGENVKPKFGTLPVAQGGTGLTSSPSMLVNLSSTTAANVMASSPKPGVTGTLGVGNGGTGATTAADARTNLGAQATLPTTGTASETYAINISGSSASCTGNSATATALSTGSDRTKLDGIASGATKVESSTTNGNVKINGTDTTVYTHPTQTAYSAKGSATKVPKITTDSTGHVTSIEEVTISGVTPASHTHGNINNDGSIVGGSGGSGKSIASGDRLIVAEATNTGKYNAVLTTAQFDGTTTSKALTPKGTFETFQGDVKYQLVEYGALQYSDITAIISAGKVPVVYSDNSLYVCDGTSYLVNGVNEYRFTKPSGNVDSPRIVYIRLRDDSTGWGGGVVTIASTSALSTKADASVVSTLSSNVAAHSTLFHSEVLDVTDSIARFLKISFSGRVGRCIAIIIISDGASDSTSAAFRLSWEYINSTNGIAGIGKEIFSCSDLSKPPLVYKDNDSFYIGVYTSQNRSATVSLMMTSEDPSKISFSTVTRAVATANTAVPLTWHAVMSETVNEIVVGYVGTDSKTLYIV